MAGIAVKVTVAPLHIIPSLLPLPEVSAIIIVGEKLKGTSSAPIVELVILRLAQSISVVTSAKGLPPQSSGALIGSAATRCRSVELVNIGLTLMAKASLPVAVCKLARVAWLVGAEILPVAPIKKVEPELT